MTRQRTILMKFALLGATAALAAGCGGGGEEAPPVDPAAGGAPTPGATTPGATVVDPAAGGGAAGTGVDPALGGGGVADAAATIPDLVGDDVSGGLGSLNGTPLFTAKAVDGNELDKGEDTVTEEKGAASTEVKTTATPAFSGAKIYVDGIVHDVTRGGSFPKGNPVFRLVSVSAADIEIELIAGEFTAGGGVGTVLDKGDLVSLLNSSEQLTYRIKYLRPIAAADATAF